MKNSYQTTCQTRIPHDFKPRGYWDAGIGIPVSAYVSDFGIKDSESAFRHPGSRPYPIRPFGMHVAKPRVEIMERPVRRGREG